LATRESQLSDQNPQLQIDALKQAGCERLYVEKASGAHRDRPELKAALEYMRPWRHLGGLAPLPVGAIASTDHRDRPRPRAKETSAQVLTRNIDTGTPEGRLFFHITAAFDEFQRELIVENTKAGLVAARKRGRRGGRPKVLDKERIPLAEAMLRRHGELPVCRGCHRSTQDREDAFYRYFPSDRIHEPGISLDRPSLPVSFYVPLRKRTHLTLKSSLNGKRQTVPWLRLKSGF